MLNKQLLNPNSIVVVGGSNNLEKPGGKVLKNLIDGKFRGDLFVVNNREDRVQNIKSFQTTDKLPCVDLAIIAIPAVYCPQTIEQLGRDCNTKAFIVLSAGFSEIGEEGRLLETQMVKAVNKVNGCLIGPNCIGVLNKNYCGVFTTPIPDLTMEGCDLISSSGATAVFIMEVGMFNGLRFSNVFSIGNGAQIGVEEVLEEMDINFDPKTSSRIKLIYVENIKDPKKFLKHTQSLIRKGCRIAGIKAGLTAEGGRAAASHTGAIATSDIATSALFRKAGIIHCRGREQLITIASVLSYKELTGKNIAIITHAGGSAVMLTDALVNGGLKVPKIEGESGKELLSYLYPGSSISNPIDFLATGTASQLGIIIDYCEHKFDQIDAMVVVFGSPGLFNVENVYKVLTVKMDICSKPIYPVLPSVVNASKEISYFLSKGRINFSDEVTLGNALCQVYNTPQPSSNEKVSNSIDGKKIRKIIDNASNGFLSVGKTQKILDAAKISRIKEVVVKTETSAIKNVKKIGFPVVMKVIGPIHKSDIGGVVLDIKLEEDAIATFKKLMKLEGAEAVLIQPMSSGIELFVGASYEEGMGHLVMCGMGGVYIEILKDIEAGLAPLNKEQAKKMLQRLKVYPIIKGIRNSVGVDEELIIDVMMNVSALLEIAPEIIEMDLNPLLGKKDSLIAVDSRIRINK